MHGCLKVVSQVDSVVTALFCMSAFIWKGSENKSCDIMMQLYKSLMSPHLKCRVQFHSLHYQKDVIKLERVQKRFTRMLPGLGL